MKNYEIELNDELYYFPILETKTVDKKRFYVTPEEKSIHLLQQYYHPETKRV